MGDTGMRTVSRYGQNRHAGSPVMGTRLAVNTGAVSQKVGSVLPASAKRVSDLVLCVQIRLSCIANYPFHRQRRRTAFKNISTSAVEAVCLAVTENGKSSLSANPCEFDVPHSAANRQRFSYRTACSHEYYLNSAARWRSWRFTAFIHIVWLSTLPKPIQIFH